MLKINISIRKVCADLHQGQGDIHPAKSRIYGSNPNYQQIRVPYKTG
jgi:hypothetical protein